MWQCTHFTRPLYLPAQLFCARLRPREWRCSSPYNVMNLKEGQRPIPAPIEGTALCWLIMLQGTKERKIKRPKARLYCWHDVMVVGAKRQQDLLERGFCWVPNPLSVLSPFGLFSTVTDWCGSAHKTRLLVLLLLC